MIENTNKIVIFDWGGVILHEFPSANNDREAIVRTIKHFNNNLSEEEAYEVYLKAYRDENGVYISVQNDDVSKRKWVERIRKEAKTNIIYNDFIDVFSKEYQKISYYKDIVEYAYSLKNKCKIGLFSNLIFTCYDALNKQVDLSKFNYVWLSYETHERKPDEKAFIIVENDTKISPENILFIDDKMRNLKAAKKRGWNICCATGNEFNKIKETVDNFLATKNDEK